MVTAPGQRFRLSQRIAIALIPPCAALLIRLLDRTLRYEVIVEPGAVPGSTSANQIWCFWHRCLLPVICYFQGRISPGVLVSRSFDGELVAKTVERLGFRPVRGSSSRAGARGFLGLVKMLEAGHAAVLVADGPHGPLFQAKPGAVKLAQISGRPIGAFYFHPARAWTLRSWDGFLIPKPFSRVAICWSTLVPPPGTKDEASLEESRRALQSALERVRRLAEEHFGR